MRMFNILKECEEEVDNTKLILINKNKGFIVSIPHSGVLIPAKFKGKFILGRCLLIDTDLYTDIIFDLKSCIVLKSKLNQYFINFNRTREDTKIKEGATNKIFLDGRIVRNKEYNKEEETEILNYYDKYHALLQESIKEMKKLQGFALVLDGHAMNSTGLKMAPDYGKERADFVVGTKDDMSADPTIISAFVDTLTKEAANYGLTIKKNNPYSGGFITQNYGKPKDNVHVIQLEVKKENYMHEALNEKYFNEKSFTIKQEKAELVKKIISKAINAAYKKAKEIYQNII